MASRRNTRSKEAQLAFEAISIEGGLLSPEWLSKVAQLAAGSQTESDYRIPKGLNLRDEIGRYWRIAQAHWKDFATGLASTADRKALAENFVLSVLRESFDFKSLKSVEAAVISEREYPIGNSAFDKRVPVVIAPAASGIDTLSPAFGEDGRRRSAFGLAQEYLNAAEGALWGIVTDGSVLRVIRDNASLTRPAWIEADLSRIFTEERYADFTALWLLLHESRFGRDGQPVTDCALESWRNAGREEGTRAREHLRKGVEEALIALGQGFLSHPENQELRGALQSGSLNTRDYFAQLLRLVYRLIFLLTVEERNLLHAADAGENIRKLYAQGYSLRRLAEKSVKRNAHDRFSDLWDSLKIVLRSLAAGESRLGLPALAGIFATSQCPALDSASLENRALLLAVFKLAWLREDGALARVNWRDMGPEELGSVYESLLELVPQISNGGRQFGFAVGDETKGNARKTSGSYYTPDSLVQVLLDSALEPVITDTIARNPSNAVEALLGLSIVDPACGSGHFLLAAARRLAAHVARLQANGTPSATEYRHALRQVVGKCIYGVDLNPMAVELCKVSLWMEAVEPGLPLTFLNSHIQHGNALLGTTPELMEKGIPDAAWEPIDGDDRKIASALKKRNKQGSSGQRSLDTLWSQPSANEAQVVTKAVTELEAAPDADASALAKKESRWEDILGSNEYLHQKFVADAWCAAFVWPKQPGPLAEAAPVNELWRQIRDGRGKSPELTTKTVRDLSHQYNFFHWHLQFPQVFIKGGFNVVLGNPPWERVKLQEQEFFAPRNLAIAEAPNAAVRKKLIAELSAADPVLWDEWCTASRKADGESHFIRQSNRYPMCGKGDVNTYSIFAEHNSSVAHLSGRAGFIVPSGLVTDDTTKDFFSSLVQTRRLASIYHFENEAKLFPSVHHAFRFILFTIGAAQEADLLFFARSVGTIAQKDRHFTLSGNDFVTLNPNTLTCPIFRSRRDADLNLAIYQNTGVLWREHDSHGNPWDLRFMAMIHMANDSESFRTRSDLEVLGFSPEGNRFVGNGQVFLPLYEAKMVHHFDHRFGTYEGQSEALANQGKLPELDDEDHQDPWRVTMPEYWVPRTEVNARLDGRTEREWFLGWRKITGTEKQRTVIASLTPKVAAGDSYYIALSEKPAELINCLYANLCSFPFDYAARQKVGGTNLVYHTFKQFPALHPGAYEAAVPWDPRLAKRTWISHRALELTYTAWDLEPFARDVGFDGPPFRWDPARRFLLRCELDAAFFHLYGISRDDTDYIMDTFPIVRKNDEKAHGEYRTKRVILEIYDEMAEAIRTGKPYQTRLDPPPASIRVAHPFDWTRQPFQVPAEPRVPFQPANNYAPTVMLELVYLSNGRLPWQQLRKAWSLLSNPNELAKNGEPMFGSEVRNWRREFNDSVAPDDLIDTLSGFCHSGTLALPNRDGAKIVEFRNEEDYVYFPHVRCDARLALAVAAELPDEPDLPPSTTAVLESISQK